jgi:hypothetical protein
MTTTEIVSDLRRQSKMEARDGLIFGGPHNRRPGAGRRRRAGKNRVVRRWWCRVLAEWKAERA